MKGILPMKVLAFIPTKILSLEIPKSPKLQWPSLSNRMFWSFISLPIKDINHMKIIGVVFSRKLNCRLSETTIHYGSVLLTQYCAGDKI